MTPRTNKIKPAVIKRAIKLYQDGKLTTAEICKACGISWGTLYNYSKKQGIERRTLPRHQRQPKPIEEFKGCPKCKNVEGEPKYNVVDFPNTASGIVIYKTVACRGCRRKYFKTNDIGTGETKTFLLL